MCYINMQRCLFAQIHLSLSHDEFRDKPPPGSPALELHLCNGHGCPQLQAASGLACEGGLARLRWHSFRWNSAIGEGCGSGQGKSRRSSRSSQPRTRKRAIAGWRRQLLTCFAFGLASWASIEPGHRRRRLQSIGSPHQRPPCPWLSPSPPLPLPPAP